MLNIFPGSVMKKSQCKAASIIWKNNSIPISEDFNDTYFSIDDGMAEAKYVFIEGNNLINRLANGFEIAELGFGVGLNLLSLIKFWNDLNREGKISFTSFEAYPAKYQDVEKALKYFPILKELTSQLIPALEANLTNFEIENVRIKLIYGDVRNTISFWYDNADAWFLDGFSPIKNPEMWEESLLMAVQEKTKPGGTFATYTSAGAVRRSLTKVGFEVSKISGFGKKRHMLLGKKID